MRRRPDIASGRNQYAQFKRHLKNRLLARPGWIVSFESETHPRGVTFQCPHGVIYEETLYDAMMADCLDAKGIADQCLRRATDFCETNQKPSEYVVAGVGGWTTVEIVGDLTITWSAGSWSTTGTQWVPISPSGGIYNQLLKVCPSLATFESKCPACRGTRKFNPEPQNLGNLIPHLNDSHKWTREHIANWLDSLEDVDLTIRRERETVDA